MTLRLADLEAPLDDVEFPNGAKHQPVPFGPTEYKLWREVEQGADGQRRADALEQIIRACYPTATDEDFATCTPRMMLALIAHAGRRIEQVKEALKNANAVAMQQQATPPSGEAVVTPPLSPNASGNTSSPRSRRKRGKTGGASTIASPTDDPSSSGSATTTSQSDSGSTPYAVSWKTSTAPPSMRSA